tara:strand:+ start:396 stop:635 length:240 start_codon:yes stop_codon:yes gene_type:complete
VNCDKRELEFKESLKEHEIGVTMPFDTPDATIAKLEEQSQASTIPRISIYSVSKGYEKPSVLDIKQIILKNEDPKESIN